ncbi:Gfo/Idh/MocA family oxidoreductase [Actinopolymorpha sp. B11F2]|uniref:Gfo/Idh/MocA family protein n=1 Tax=Actinopolymorpha sp. B11F2 TaxID=3160862 RepID=UPI0032E50961
MTNPASGSSGTNSSGDNAPLRAILVGVGAMGRGWLRNLQAADDVELVGVADLDVTAAKTALDEAGLSGVPVAGTLEELVDETAADFVVDVTIPEAHHAVTMQALRRGLPVLGEKPLAATLSEALDLVAAAQVYDRLFMVSQSRRYNPQLFAFRRMIRQLGGLGILVAEFFKAPHFGGFRDAMDHPLVLDMAIHTFDSVRFLTGAEPVAVYCDEYNPAWSWYAGDAATTAIFEMNDGSRFVYTGSWCSEGLETSWNSAWRASGEHGTTLWDGDGPPTLEIVEGRATAPVSDTGEVDPLDGIAGSLRDFVQALRSGRPPMGEARDNLMSLAMVHAAIASAGSRQRVLVADVLAQAHAEALARVDDAAVGDVLRSWTTLTPPS